MRLIREIKEKKRIYTFTVWIFYFSILFSFQFIFILLNHSWGEFLEWEKALGAV